MLWGRTLRDPPRWRRRHRRPLPPAAFGRTAATGRSRATSLADYAAGHQWRAAATAAPRPPPQPTTQPVRDASAAAAGSRASGRAAPPATEAAPGAYWQVMAVQRQKRCRRSGADAEGQGLPGHRQPRHQRPHARAGGSVSGDVRRWAAPRPSWKRPGSTVYIKSRSGNSVSQPLVQILGTRDGAARPRLPEWARKSRTHFESLNRLKSGFRELNLHTVCESARCPNIHECFHRGAATFMILGNWCTRGCGFCSVPKGNPAKHDMRLDPDEPANVARMAADMKLRYVVITSVNRDDLRRRRIAPLRRNRARGARRSARGARGSAHAGFLRRSGRRGARAGCRPARLQSQHGDGAAPLPPRAPAGRTTGSRSTCWLSPAGTRPGVLTKSGFMVGLGETEEEVRALLRDLRAAGTDVATIGQYLQPTRRNLPVAEYVTTRAVRGVPRLRPVARLQNGVQRAAGAQFLHGR